MDSLEHGAAEALQIPRFDDGMVNIQGNFCTEGNVQSLAHFDSSGNVQSLTEESIALASSPAKAAAPAATYDGSPEEHARRIIEVVVADNPIGRRAA